MARSRFCAGFLSVTLALLASTASGQITTTAGDGVLNAPYRGTIDSLRNACEAISYGEVRSFVEPSGSSSSINSTYLLIWVDMAAGSLPWDRSALRMYEGLDASGGEIDLTTCTDEASAYELYYPGEFERFSFKAIGTKTLAVQTFKVHFKYRLSGSSSWSNPIRTISVAPVTGSFLNLPGESEAFHYGTPILDVTAGAARLTVPIGRTADMIGACFIDYRKRLGPSLIPAADMVFPGAAESVYVQHYSQFQLGGSIYAKYDWGTPWAGYLLGYYVSGDVYYTDGTQYDVQQSNVDYMNRVNYIRPQGVDTTDPATQSYVYDVDGYLYQIKDGATPANNVITLERDINRFVNRVTTSDGRGWTIQSDTNSAGPTYGQITGVIPDGGAGARYFSWSGALSQGGRVSEVRTSPTPGVGVMYQFVYGADGDLTEEWQNVGGTLQKVVEHVPVNATHRQRREYVTGGYQQYDFAYDAAYPNRLASITSYSGLNGTGTASTTTYTHNVDNGYGNMIVTQVDLPDSSRLTYEYDAEVGVPATSDAPFGFRSKTTRTVETNSLPTYDVEYEFFYDDDGTTRLHYLPFIVNRYATPDIDRDGDVDLGDFLEFQACFNGPNRPPAKTPCPKTDYDQDNDVDLADFLTFQSCFNGPNRPAACL
jgi:hypothetical protein